jgi:hypothetical protein
MKCRYRGCRRKSKIEFALPRLRPSNFIIGLCLDHAAEMLDLLDTTMPWLRNQIEHLRKERTS